MRQHLSWRSGRKLRSSLISFLCISWLHFALCPYGNPKNACRSGGLLVPPLSWAGFSVLDGYTYFGKEETRPDREDDCQSRHLRKPGTWVQLDIDRPGSRYPISDIHFSEKRQYQCRNLSLEHYTWVENHYSELAHLIDNNTRPFPPPPYCRPFSYRDTGPIPILCEGSQTEIEWLERFFECSRILNLLFERKHTFFPVNSIQSEDLRQHPPPYISVSHWMEGKILDNCSSRREGFLPNCRSKY